MDITYLRRVKKTKHYKAKRYLFPIILFNFKITIKLILKCIFHKNLENMLTVVFIQNNLSMLLVKSPSIPATIAKH